MTDVHIFSHFEAVVPRFVVTILEVVMGFIDQDQGLIKESFSYLKKGEFRI
jgi:hypothetical protein